MNERIVELAKQCASEDHLAVYGGNYAKFAELIVQECAKVLTQHGAYFSGNGEPYHYAAYLIEEHFGVEE